MNQILFFCGCRHSALSLVRISKHLINLICRKCGLSYGVWKSDLVDGPVIDYTEEERELLK
jgi:transcription elongation factor Elf1